MNQFAAYSSSISSSIGWLITMINYENSPHYNSDHNHSAIPPNWVVMTWLPVAFPVAFPGAIPGAGNAVRSQRAAAQVRQRHLGGLHGGDGEEAQESLGAVSELK